MKLPLDVFKMILVRDSGFINDEVIAAMIYRAEDCQSKSALVIIAQHVCVRTFLD
jgi:hypothetical protein